jgi:hypothetical protein
VAIGSAPGTATSEPPSSFWLPTKASRKRIEADESAFRCEGARPLKNSCGNGSLGTIRLPTRRPIPQSLLPRRYRQGTVLTSKPFQIDWKPAIEGMTR